MHIDIRNLTTTLIRFAHHGGSRKNEDRSNNYLNFKTNFKPYQFHTARKAETQNH
ncbi:hypothetical protein KUV23_06385 [Algoriphagus marincola]|uniref:Uncharacterized protein n=1 Tax=Algoriphagus marincola TaxID=264027 RepID=A0ABS7N2N4_9BACT|nr:hypothetical protein [Algoriphagus marincola]MBY5950592.1 hypothetical protein [Algoriphagus marincola]